MPNNIPVQEQSWTEKRLQGLQKQALETAFQEKVASLFHDLFSELVGSDKPDHSAATQSFRNELNLCRLALELALREIDV